MANAGSVGDASAINARQERVTPGPTSLAQQAWAGGDNDYRGYALARRGRPLLDHRVRLAVRLLPERPGCRLLDLGAGDGYLTGVFARRTGAAVAVALDAGTPTPAAAVAPLAPLARVVADAGRPLPFPPHSFDVVVSLETVEHLLDPDLLLSEARRVLRPGGTLVLSTPRLDSLLVIASLLAGLQPPAVDASSRRRYGNPLGAGRPSGHLHLFTRRALLEALAANGFALDAYREARFSSSWRHARAGQRWRWPDVAAEACFAAYDLVPVRKDVMVVRATQTSEASS